MCQFVLLFDAIRAVTPGLTVGPFFHQEQGVLRIKLWIFVWNMQLYLPIIFTLNICIALSCLVFANRVTYMKQNLTFVKGAHSIFAQ